MSTRHLEMDSHDNYYPLTTNIIGRLTYLFCEKDVNIFFTRTVKSKLNFI